MPKARSAYLLDRIFAIAERVKSEQNPWLEEDIEDILLEAAEYLREALDVPRLERELVSHTTIDRDALNEVMEWFAAIGARNSVAYSYTFPDGTTFDWTGRIERLRELLAGLGQPEGLEQLEVTLRLALVGDAAFASMLMALVPDHKVRGRLEAKLLSKLALLSDEQALGLWAGLREEADPSREVHLKANPKIAPHDFFNLGDAHDARRKIATYLTKVRPLLVRKTFDSSSTHVPAGHAGVATILSWTEVPSTRIFTATDRAVVRALGRVVWCGRSTKADLSAALGVQPEGYFFGGRGEQEAKRSWGTDGPKTLSKRPILDELSKLIQIADQRAAHPEAPVERALRAYKLGLEVMAQDLPRDFVKRGELRLQRQMCRFLVERDVRAYGTKFGRSEVDLRADDSLGAVIVETKILRSAPSERHINRWLTQLGSYMDQEYLALRGALVLYNFSPKSILCSSATLRFRYLIFAINLCPESPSRRKASIEIEATKDGPEIIRVHQLGDLATPRRRVSVKQRPRVDRKRKRAP